MATFSEEWVTHQAEDIGYDFSINKIFQKLKDGEGYHIICEGYGITAVFNEGDECYVVKDGVKKMFYDLSGIQLKKEESFKPLIQLFLIILLAWVLTWILIVTFIPLAKEGESEVMSRGVFGDMFGSINALFSGLALAGIIYTINLQKKELKLQRKELSATREEFKTQNETLLMQKFETTFFNLVRNHEQLMDTIPEQVHISGRTIRRYNALNKIKEDFDSRMNSLKKVIKSKKIGNRSYLEGFPGPLLESINYYHHICEDTLQIIKFIDKPYVKDQIFYYSMLNNSLSKSEKYLLGFYLEFLDKETQNSMDAEIAIFQHEYLQDIERVTRRGQSLPPKIEILDYGSRNVLYNSFINEIGTTFFGFVNVDEQKLIISEVNVFLIETNQKKYSEELSEEIGYSGKWSLPLLKLAQLDSQTFIHTNATVKVGCEITVVDESNTSYNVFIGVRLTKSGDSVNIVVGEVL